MEERIIKILGLAFNKDLSDAKVADCVPDKIEGWDSLAYLNLVTLLEEEFSVSFELADIAEMAEGGEALLKVVKKVTGA